MSGSRFFSIRKNEGLKGTDDGNSCKSNPRVAVCTHLYTLSIGNSAGCNEGSLRRKNVKRLIVLQRYQHLVCRLLLEKKKRIRWPRWRALIVSRPSPGFIRPRTVERQYRPITRPSST